MNFVFLESAPRRFTVPVTVQVPGQSGPVPQTGSSPLARGTQERAGDGPDRRRFIPARAGNTESAIW